MTYTYKCENENCKTEFEIQKGINEEISIKCPKCSSDKVHRIFKPIGNIWNCQGSYNQTRK